MIDFAYVPFHEVSQELRPNVSRYHEEMNMKDIHSTIDVDWESYEEAGRQACCCVITARDKGKLIGYSIYQTSHSLRHKDFIEADNHGIFVEKPYRGRVGVQMLKWADAVLTACGVHQINYTMNDPKVGNLLSRLGYKPAYTIWSKHNGQ